MTSLSIAATAERERALATIRAAFRNDPIARWVYPNDATYEAAFDRVADAMAGGAFDNNSAYATNDFGGAALWLPPGVHSDGDAMGAVMAETVDESQMEDLLGFS